MLPIPFNRPALAGREFDYVRQAIENMHLSGNGPFTGRCQALLEQCLGAPKVLLTTSCTHALEMAALLLDIRPGDEVILPSFTFVSTANAFVLRGARPVFVDVRPDTFNLDETQLERLITPRTKAIVAVHYAGVGCEMDAVMKTADRRGVPVVEDNAHGLLGRYRGKGLGTFGALAAQSFHETKNITCGEGGALVVNQPRYLDRAEIIREKGTDRHRFFKGQVDKYTWVDVGSSYLPSEILAAFLYAQLEVRDAIQVRRRGIWEFYAEHLREWSSSTGVRLPVVPAHCEQSHHMFYLVAPSLAGRQALIAHLARQGVSSVFHYQPLHLSEMGRQYGYRAGDFPVTERAGDCLLRLPFHNALTAGELERVVAAVTSVRL